MGRHNLDALARRFAMLPILVLFAQCDLALRSPKKEEAPSESKTKEWASYGSDKANTKYSPLEQIDKPNLKNLRLAWRWTSPDGLILPRLPGMRSWLNEATPIIVGSVLYTSTALSQVAAINAATGQTLWVYDPKTYETGPPANFGFVHRGVAHWTANGEQRLFIGTGDAYLIALDPKTGRPVPGFGNQGRVDLTEGLHRPVERAFYAVNSPPIVCSDVVVVGSSVLDIPGRNNMPPGDIRGFDVRTGRQLWTFHSVPQDGEKGNETWGRGSWQEAGNVNAWSILSADEELGYVYLPFSAPDNEYYGGRRPGDNLYGESLVCLDAQTGKRVWHFQMVHHSLWDYDLPAAPNLVDVRIDGETFKSVAQVTKQGFCFVFDRVTGRPRYPIEERQVPKSVVPGEVSSRTQPFPSKPAPFDRQGVSVDDLIDFTPELRREAEAILSRYSHGPLYTPPGERPTAYLPSAWGGASWAGAAFDPETSFLYVPSVTMAYALVLRRSSDGQTTFSGAQEMIAGPQGLPLYKPPYGRITAIDLSNGKHAFVVPLGEGPRNHPLLRNLKLPSLGWPRRGFLLVTKSLLFAGQEGEVTRYRPTVRGNSVEVEVSRRDPKFRAFDKSNGELVWEIDLPSNCTGSPMTYETKGKQYIVIPIGGADEPAELVALSLP